MAPQQVPSIGRIVHYILPSGPKKGEHRPALIVKVWESDAHPDGHPDNLVQLQVFTDGANDGAEYAPGLHWATSVHRADAHLHEFGTYHFPEYVPAKESATLPASQMAGGSQP